MKWGKWKHGASGYMGIIYYNMSRNFPNSMKTYTNSPNESFDIDIRQYMIRFNNLNKQILNVYIRSTQPNLSLS